MVEALQGITGLQSGEDVNKDPSQAVAAINGYFSLLHFDTETRECQQYLRDLKRIKSEISERILDRVVPTLFASHSLKMKRADREVSQALKARMAQHFQSASIGEAFAERLARAFPFLNPQG